MSTILTGSVGDQVYTMTWTGSSLEGAPANIQAWLDTEVGPSPTLDALTAALPRLFGDTLTVSASEAGSEEPAPEPPAPEAPSDPPAPEG